MRPSLQIAGILALGATLLLSGPGVRVVRADEALVAAAPPAPSCSAATVHGVDLEALNRQLEKLRAEAPSGELTLVLNTRGYGYHPDALEQIRRDMLRVEREGK